MTTMKRQLQDLAAKWRVEANSMKDLRGNFFEMQMLERHANEIEEISQST